MVRADPPSGPAPSSPGPDPWLRILRDEQGFDEFSTEELEEWARIARASSFKRVRGVRLEACPDCGGERLRRVGQYVYYSNLAHLERCIRCDLVFSDLRLPAQVVQEHFEVAYKSPTYFEEQRSRIFEAIVDLADDCVPRGGRVIDIGGAQGHLLAALQARRPDLDLLLNDLSARACAHAADVYGLQTHCGPMSDLCDPADAPFDLALLIDVIYYEPNLAGLWDAIDRSVRRPGSVILRVPNSFPLIRAHAALQRALSPRRARHATSLRLFNPEHIYVFTRAYLRRRLASLGFHAAEFLPSPLLTGGAARSPIRDAAGWGARLIARSTGGRALPSPSMLIRAQRG